MRLLKWKIELIKAHQLEVSLDRIALRYMSRPLQANMFEHFYGVANLPTSVFAAAADGGISH